MLNKNKTEFLAYLESLKVENNAILIESLKDGFSTVFEAVFDNPVVLELMGHYKGRKVIIELYKPEDVDASYYGGHSGFSDSSGPIEPDDGEEYEINSYKAIARLTFYDSFKYDADEEETTERVMLNQDNFGEVTTDPARDRYNYKTRKIEKTNVTLDVIVEEYIQENIDDFV